MEHTFTDEQLLNLVNNTIITKTEYKVDQFTGGYVSMTSTHGNTKETYKAVILFGYENRNSRAHTIEISDSLVYIWTNALMLKIASIRVTNTGQDLSELNDLMNTKKEEKKEGEKAKSYDSRTIAHCTSTSILISNYLNTSTYTNEVKNFLDIKSLVIEFKRDAEGKHVRYEFEGEEVAVSDIDIPYYLTTSNNLTKQEADRFYKHLLAEYKKGN